MRNKRVFEEGETVEIRYLPGEKDWERAAYVRRVKQEEMPALWRGPLGHIVELSRPGDRRRVQISGQRIRKVEKRP